MNRHLRWAMLIAVGILLGAASSSFQQSKADPPAADGNDRGTAAIVAELKEIKAQLKGIDQFLRNGVIKNFPQINPPPEHAETPQQQ